MSLKKYTYLDKYEPEKYDKEQFTEVYYILLSL